MASTKTTQWSPRRRHRTRSSHHKHLRLVFLQDRENQVIMLPGACVYRNGMIVGVCRTCLLEVQLDQFIVLPGACVRPNGMSDWALRS
ncbi:hypothetical protein MTO96_024417 [Rhipicephalus appendiculatus]